VPEPTAKPRADVFSVLVRLFFSRFFDKESLSPQGDAEANVVQTLGMLAAPGGLISLILYFNPQIKVGWSLVSVRSLFLSASMAVIAFIVVFEWDALFLDRRDYQVLLPLPLPLWKLFVAKMTAFVVFLGLFLAAINVCATLFWPSVFDPGNYFVVMATHLLVVIAAGLFSALAAACVQGLLLALVPARIFRPVATASQTILMSGLVMLFFLCPLFAGGIQMLVQAHSGVARYIPAYWFAGLYERLRPATGNPALLNLGKMALPGLGWALATFALTHLPGYRRQARKLIEAPPSNPAGPGRLRVALNGALDRLLLKDPVQQGVYHFIGQTIGRSMKHRLFLAVYAGFGAALVVFGIDQNGGEGLLSLLIRGQRFVPDPIGLLRIPFTLSFILITGLRAAFSFPAELTANWAFQISDANQTRQCMIAMRKWIVVCGVMPLLLLLVPLELAFFSWAVVLIQTAFGLTVSILLVELMFFDFRKIPFTCGYFPERNNLVWLIAIYVAGLVLYSGKMADMEIWLIWEPQYIAVLVLAAACLWLAVWKWHGRAHAQTGLDYLGDPDPMIRTLELTPH
jgi:hypothetical protein